MNAATDLAPKPRPRIGRGGDGNEPVVQWSRPLSDPDDGKFLSELVMLVRSQIELFTATPEDLRERNTRGGRRGCIDVGRVGIRCAHCVRQARLAAGKELHSGSGRPPSSQRTKPAQLVKGAVSYPKEMRLVYQAVRNWQRHHFLACPAMPADVKATYDMIKAGESKTTLYPMKRSGNDSVEHWVASLRRKGLIDTPDRGIRLGEGASENGITQISTGNSPVVSASTPLHTLLEYQESCIKRTSDSLSHACNLPAPGPIHGYSEDAGGSCIEENYPSLMHLLPGDTANHKVDGTTGKPPVSVAPMRVLMTDQVLSVAPLDTSDREIWLSEGGASQSQSEKQLKNSQAPKVAPFRGSPQPDGRSIECDSIHTPIQMSGGEMVGGEHPPSASTCKSSPVPGAKKMTRDKSALLDRLELAHSMVETVENMRRLPPPGGHDGETSDKEDIKEDLHSLGADLYELFSGRQPFEGASQLEAAAIGTNGSDDTAQAAKRNKQAGTQTRGKGSANEQDGLERRKYVPLSELGIPSATLCILVSSLLGAGAGGASSSGGGDNKCTYGSIEEVKEDLSLMMSNPDRYFFDRLAIAAGEIPEFKLPRDVLYGREGEVSILCEAYSSVAAARTDGNTGRTKRELVLLSGYAGSGKTEIFRNAQSLLIQRGAHFVCVKFDAMQQVLPLSAVSTALDDFFNLLGQEEGLSDEARSAVATAIGGEGSVLTDLIPNLGHFINVADSFSVQIDGRQAQLRLTLLFRMLFQAVCAHVGPVVLFLDDLQWADEPSLDLFRVLATDVQIKGLLLVGTFRDCEVGPDHSLSACFRDVERSGNVAVTWIHVGNLDKGNVSALLSDALHVLPRTTLSLAEVVLQKTGGNALFVSQFLQSLFDDALLYFSISTRRWEWNTDRIREKGISDDVIGLMTEKLLKLEPAVQSALAIAAVFGAKIHESICHILGRGDLLPSGQGCIDENLDLATADGLVVKDGSIFKFHHDQIQIAAYQLVPETDREKFHLQVGRALWQLSSFQELEDFLFVVVDQLHRGSRLITDRNEKIRFAELCLLAGNKANAMSAFLPASVYLKSGIDLLAEEDWKDHRDLCLSIHSACAEVEYILGDFTSMQGHLEAVFTNARTLWEKLRAYHTLIQSLGVQHKTKDAMHTAIEVLRKLGVYFPSTTSGLVQKEILATRDMVEKADINSLHETATIIDPDKKEAMRFLSTSSVFAFSYSKDYWALVTSRMVQFSLLHGVCKESATGFAGFAMILCAMGHVDTGHCLGKTALLMIERFQAKECITRVYPAVYAFVSPCVQPIQSSLPCLEHAIDVGISLGDAENAMVNAHLYAGIALQSGQPLGPLVEKMKSHSKQMLEYNPLFDTLTKPIRQAALNLLGRSPIPFKLVGEEMDENRMLMNAELPAVLRQNINCLSMWLKYLFEEYEVTPEGLEEYRNVGKDNLSLSMIHRTCAFYSGLTALAIARKQEQQQGWLRIIDSSMKQMKEWAASSNWNFQHKLELMNAEYAYLMGDVVTAAEKYELAAKLAAAHRFVHEEALALERAGIFHSETGDPAAASEYFLRACGCYSKWGACSKVAFIQERYH